MKKILLLSLLYGYSTTIDTCGNYPLGLNEKLTYSIVFALWIGVGTSQYKSIVHKSSTILSSLPLIYYGLHKCAEINWSDISLN